MTLYPWPAPLLRFVDLFNRGEFWESHEVLEAPWREHRSGFYKALILFASAYVHVQRGNARGVAAQMRKAQREFAPYRPFYLGIGVDALVEETEAVQAALRDHATDAARSREPFQAPVLQLDAALVSGMEPELRS
jgi:predicted metal-dependent hydrolase